MESEDTIKPIDVYTGKAWEVVVVRYLLNKDGIKTWLTNEKSDPIGKISNMPDAWETVTIKVSGLDYDRAKFIVAEYEKKAREDNFQIEP